MDLTISKELNLKYFLYFILLYFLLDSDSILPKKMLLFKAVFFLEG